MHASIAKRLWTALGTAAALAGLAVLFLMTAEMRQVVAEGVTNAAALLVDGLSDSMRQVIETAAVALVALTLAATAFGLLWLLLRLFGQTPGKAALWALAATVVVSGATALLDPWQGEALFAYPPLGAAVGGVGCIGCILLYRVLRKKLPAVFNRETVSYVIFGALTTVVSFVSQMALHAIALGTIPETIGSWICAVLFAYVVNKLFVFESHTDTAAAFFRELGLFIAARLASLGIEVVFMWLTVDVLHWPYAGCKLAAQVIILIMNYVFSKLVIFRGKKNKEE
ncbi:MAG: GtrA family protein [Clostridia bacterium]|nr:GtrA family protein [Clostridia bacterium]